MSEIKTFKLRVKRDCVHWCFGSPVSPNSKCKNKNVLGVEFIDESGFSYIDTLCEYCLKKVKEARK